ncbi:hypothetical protein LI90_2205 [Carbonactinospora thermoautotrophica]|uniref:Uncharacterized protein n=1 Tax=Carbonactinospora thermoautotrophica TaxID=1469144 RepID=A0A132MTI4_9ACTN|nr:IS3 family transposase [Carbonactinospora thermoautotrophica]KWX01177.1 hypothetical protein LI90_2205 [Carbonactinospora thermoautotrophica]
MPDADREERLAEQIREIFNASGGAYGWPRVAAGARVGVSVTTIAI